MLGRKLRAAHVVGADDVAPFRGAGDEDRRHPAVAYEAHAGGVACVGQEEQARDAMVEKAFDAFVFELRVGLRVAESQPVSARRSVALKLLHHFGEEGIRQVADDDAKDICTLADHLPGKDVRAII